MGNEKRTDQGQEIIPSERKNGPRDERDTGLSERLSALRKKADEQAPSGSADNADVDRDRGQYQRGWGIAVRMMSDFVAGVAVGALIGWAIDDWFGTSPIALIGFLLCGFAAGVMNVMRTAAKMNEAQNGEDENANELDKG